MAFSANQTRLFHRTGGTTFVEIPHLMEVPELGGTPEKIDVTTLADTSRRYIPGIKDFGDLVFKFLYDNRAAGANYRTLKSMEDAGNMVTFQLRYPDGATHTFDAVPAVSMDAGSINGALTFSVSMTMQSGVTVVNPTGA